MDTPKTSHFDVGPSPRDVRKQRYAAFKELFGLEPSFADIVSEKRDGSIPLIRQVLIWARMYAGREMSNPRKTVDVGKIFNRDHTTVIHAVKKLRAMAYSGDKRVSNEGLELLLETAYALEETGVVSESLKERITALREREGQIIRTSSQK